MPWTREYFANSTLYFVLAFFLLTYVKSLAFCFLRSDNKDPKRDAATAPSAETMATDEPSLQEVDPVMKSPRAPKDPVKKVVATRGSKHLKKSTDAGASLETHRSTSSSDDVRVDPGTFSFVPCVIFILTCVFWIDLDEEICHFGH
jgi:hypothetical protein